MLLKNRCDSLTAEVACPPQLPDPAAVMHKAAIERGANCLDDYLQVPNVERLVQEVHVSGHGLQR